MAMSIVAPAKTQRCFNPYTAGFTLLEVMVAVAVIGIALVPLLRLHLLSLDATIYAQDLTTAVGLAQELMADMPAVPEPGDDKGEFKKPYDRFRWRVSVGEKEEVVIPNLDAPEGSELPPFEVQRIEVTVLWMDGRREKLYTLESYAVQ